MIKKVKYHNIFVDGSNCVCYIDRYLRNKGLKVNNTAISRNAFKQFRWNPNIIADIIVKNGKHVKYDYDVNMHYNMYFASSISCRFSNKLEKSFNELGYNTYRENHTNNDKERKVDTYLHNNIISVANDSQNNSIFYIVTGDVNEENNFSFPQLAEFLAKQNMYVSILTPGRPHAKFLKLQNKYPTFVQVKSFSANNIISAMIHKNKLL